MTAKRTDKYIVTELKHPKVEGPWSPPVGAAEKGHGGRVLFLDKDVAPGAFYIETVWITPFKPGERPNLTPEQAKKMEAAVKPHKHDFDEVLCFFGTDPDDVHDLDAEIEFWLGGEKQIITKSTMVYIPAGVEHCPLVFHKVNRPIFHFTSFPEGKIYYEGKEPVKK